MIAIPSMLAYAATKAGIKVPEDLEDYNPEEYPHWHVYCAVQFGAACKYPGVHFDNASVVATVPNDKISKVTLQDLINIGLSVV